MSDCYSLECLEQFLEDSLEPALSNAVTSHIGECAKCQETLNELTDLSDFKKIEQSKTDNEDLVEKQVSRLARQPPILEIEESFPSSLDLGFLDAPLNPKDLGSLLHYRIKSVIGAGGMGIVFDGYDTTLQRDVAIKVFRPCVESQTQRERFLREARAVAGLRNDYIVPIYSIHVDEGIRPFMVMELIKGNSLEQVLKSKSEILPSRATRICWQVSQGLALAHASGVIHRDVKPSNILLDENTQRARITDFGLARFVEQVEPITQDGAILGTLAYMSPEQIWNSNTADCRSDVYGLGVTLYQLLTGRMPFHGSVHSIAHQIRLNDPVPVRSLTPRVPRDLETIVDKCLNKDPRSRYQTAGELSEDLKRHLEGRPVKARSISKPERAWRWCRRRPLIAAVVGLTILLAIFGPSAAIYQATLQNKIQVLMAEDDFDVAMLAASRGQWKEARIRLDKALESRHPDPFRIRLERIKSMVALGDLELAYTDLESLTSDEIPVKHLGRVRLLEGDLMLMLGDDQGTFKIQEALRYSLEPADESYAQSLLANTPQQSLERLMDTLEHDPFHFQGTGMIVTTLIQLGRLDEARQRAQLREYFFPEDPNFPLLQAVIYAINDDLPNAKLKLKKSEAQWAHGQMSNLEESLEHLAEFTDVMDFWERQNEFVERSTRLLKTIYSDFGQQTFKQKNSDSKSTLLSPALLRIPPVFARQNLEFQAALADWYGGRREASIAGLARLIDDGCTVGEVYFMYGMFLMIENLGQADRYLAAEQAFLDAANADSMWPNIDRESYYTAAMCAGGAFMSEQQAGQAGDQDHLKRGILNAKKRLGFGHLKREHAELLYRLGLEAKDWKFCRNILDDVRKRLPSSVTWKQYEVRLCYQEGDYSTAWTIASEVLKDDPENEEVKRFQRNALKKLKATVEKAESAKP